jgi:hypothetical protein
MKRAREGNIPAIVQLMKIAKGTLEAVDVRRCFEVVIHLLEQETDDRWAQAPATTGTLISKQVQAALEGFQSLFKDDRPHTAHDSPALYTIELDFPSKSWAKFCYLTLAIMKKCHDIPCRAGESTIDTIDDIYASLIAASQVAREAIRVFSELRKMHARNWVADQKRIVLPRLLMLDLYETDEFMEFFSGTDDNLARLLMQPVQDIYASVQKKSSEDVDLLEPAEMLATLASITPRRSLILHHVAANNGVSALASYSQWLAKSTSEALLENANVEVRANFEALSATLGSLQQAMTFGHTYVNQAISTGLLQTIKSSSTFWSNDLYSTNLSLSDFAETTKLVLIRLRSSLYDHRVIKFIVRSPLFPSILDPASITPACPYHKEWTTFVARAMKAIRLKSEYASLRQTHPCENQSVS